MIIDGQHYINAIKSTRLLIRYVDRGWRDFGHLIDHEANRNSWDENIFCRGRSPAEIVLAKIYHDYNVT